MSTAEYKYDATQYEGGAENEKCCLCFEIGCGVKTLSILGAIGGIALAVLGVLALSVNLVAGLLMIAFCLPQLAAGWLFIQYLREDSKETREGLIKAGTFQLFASVLTGAFNILGSLGVV